MKHRFIEFIDREIAVAREHAAGRAPVGGRIVAKMNAMEDRTVMAKLYEASQAGVDITLYVRGFCCLRPGVPGLSENIKVVSVIGRFLEHSRIFHFGGGKARSDRRGVVHLLRGLDVPQPEQTAWNRRVPCSAANPGLDSSRSSTSWPATGARRGSFSPTVVR